MSSLNAAPGAPSEYLRTKGEAEAVVRESGLDYTLFRPSIVFGREDNFLNLFAQMLKQFPLLIVPSAAARFQPVFVGDVARVFADALQQLDSIGQSYDLCGPKAYTMLELAQFVARTTGHDRLIFGADELLTNIMAVAMECLPVDSVCSGGCTLPFGIAAASVEATAPAWLGSHSPRGRYALFRDRTRRAA
jgi:NADH dehydrogenase